MRVAKLRLKPLKLKDFKKCLLFVRKNLKKITKLVAANENLKFTNATIFIFFKT